MLSDIEIAPNLEDPLLASPYAPIRYRNFPVWKIAKTAADRGWVSPTGVVHPDFALALKRYEHHALNMAAAFCGDDSSLEFTNLAAEMFAWCGFCVTAQLYEANGRQIFDFSDRAIEAVRDTDIANASLEGLQLPFESFYVRIGREANVRVRIGEAETPEDFAYADGAFISRPAEKGDDALHIALTLVDVNGRGLPRAPRTLRFPPSVHALPCLEALDRAVQLKWEAEQASMGEEDTAGLEAGLENMSTSLITDLRDSADFLKAAMPQLLSALFWIEGLKSSPQLRPGRDTGAEQVAQWNRASPEKQQKLKSRLTAEGYALVRLIDYDPASDGTAAQSGVKSAHMRRAHWRNQRHGPNSACVKRIRIKQMFIHSRDSALTDTPGHIYVPEKRKEA